jgi:hypothetical protein
MGVGDYTIQVDVVTRSATKWDASKESREPNWSVARTGKSVQAVLLLGAKTKPRPVDDEGLK